LSWACSATASPPGALTISEPDEARRDALENEMPGVKVIADNDAAAADAATLVLAVKPQVMAKVCKAVRPVIETHRPLIVSIAAGTTSKDIDDWCGGGLAIVRAMPNQPALLGMGVTGIVGNERAGDAELDRAEAILGATGSVVRVDSEADIDVVTAVSGSGPAYFFLLIDTLAETGARLGLDASTARTLAVETARGAAEVARLSEDDMGELISRVRSPGGTTAAALDSLDAEDVRGIFERAVTAARDRATELAHSTG
jgi:pyrroline-5-carboxylate reductase